MQASIIQMEEWNFKKHLIARRYPRWKGNNETPQRMNSSTSMFFLRLHLFFLISNLVLFICTSVKFVALKTLMRQVKNHLKTYEIHKSPWRSQQIMGMSPFIDGVHAILISENFEETEKELHILLPVHYH